MSTDHDLETKLARVHRRLEAKRRDVRQRLETVPELLDLAQAAKETFGARLIYLRIGEWEDGDRATFDERGCVWTVYTPPRKGHKGKMAAMREREK